MKVSTRRNDIDSRGRLSRLPVRRDIAAALYTGLIPRWRSVAEKVVESAIPIVGVQLDPKRDIALVTGGAGGLGQEIVRELRRRQIVTVILDVVPPPDLESLTGVHFYACDISLPGRIRVIHEKIIQDVGHVTILINNAAITSDLPLDRVDNEKIEQIIRVNLLGPYTLIREFLPSMIAIDRGYIVNIASVLGFVTPARLTAYGASKGGLIALHESLVDELEQYTWKDSSNPGYVPLLKSRGVIRSLLVCPGKITTKMFDNARSPSKIIAPDLDPQYLAKQIVKAMEYNRSGTLKLPYYTNMMCYFKSLNWPWFRLFRLTAGVDAIIAAK
ncbi:AaceriADL292Cp [[Ashbya] aceris (nom. inval.)]|nr:AaceriADL292Cp [[Ashbya] aceris (nom. inval.)]